jgi:mannose-6-phosphate isomerase-like protein (cupin superfamily)
MKFRRVVTGHSPDGKAVITSDTDVDAIRVAMMPEFELHKLWGGDTAPTYPDDGAAPDYHSWFPPVGGFRLVQFTVPPASTPAPHIADEAAALAEMEERLPGFAATLEADGGSMHRSDTLDLVYVIAGRCDLEVDDGVTVAVAAGDVVVQNGTRHAWHNPYNEPCMLLGVNIGAHSAS